VSISGYLSEFFIKTLNGLQYYTGSYAWAILIFTVVIKVLLYPLTQKQYMGMKQMQALQPELKKLQEKYKNDQKALQQAQMEFYSKSGANPLSGCLPLFIQMPILLGIYTTILNFKHVFEGEHVPFLWIGTWLSAHYPQYFAKSLADSDVPLIFLYGLSMYLSQKLTVTDPSTAQQQKSMSLIMPIMLTFMFYQWKLPCAIVLYWLSFNLLGLIQQAHIIRMPMPVIVETKKAGVNKP
jgi:YidC/Oxa1 family membrane protein insertase